MAMATTGEAPAAAEVATAELAELPEFVKTIQEAVRISKYYSFTE